MISRRHRYTIPLLVLLAFAPAASVLAQKPAMKDAAAIPHPPLGPIPAAAQFDVAGHLDPESATRAYLDTIPLDKRQASNKYFEGNYWLILWDALYAIAVLLFLLSSGISAKLRHFATAHTPQWLSTPLYVLAFLLLFTLLEAPLTFYEGLYREHLYQQSHQAFSGWLHDQLIGLLLTLILGSVVITALYAIARRLPRTWHLWGAAFICLFSAFLAVLAPVYLSPLFNTYSRIDDPTVTTPLLQMARANGIPVDAIYQVDASKQSTHVSANVSGLLNTTRITLNDNLLRTCSLEEIEDTTGHEMGHYVLNHNYKGLLESFIIVFVTLAILRTWLESMQRRHASRWHTESIYDPAMLPAVFLIVIVVGLLLTPITNTGTRLMEREADIFGLNAARQPDGSAQVDLKLGQYRKLEPTLIEEFLFFDHPSGHTRIRDAMDWKSQNQSVSVYR